MVAKKGNDIKINPLPFHELKLDSEDLKDIIAYYHKIIKNKSMPLNKKCSLIEKTFQSFMVDQ